MEHPGAGQRDRPGHEEPDGEQEKRRAVRKRDFDTAKAELHSKQNAAISNGSASTPFGRR